MPFEIWREKFINDADLALARWSYSQLSPQPFQPLVEPLDLKKFHAWKRLGVTSSAPKTPRCRRANGRSEV